MWKEKELNIAVPSFGHLSDLFAKISIKVKHYCNKAAKRAKSGEKVDRGGPSWSDSNAADSRVNSIVKIKLQIYYSLALKH